MTVKEHIVNAVILCYIDSALLVEAHKGEVVYRVHDGHGAFYVTVTHMHDGIFTGSDAV